MKTIFVSAYPKSGSTYLTSLLGDALNCPTGGNRIQEDETEIATKDRPNKKYFIRKGHYQLVGGYCDILVPSPHKMNWQYLDNHHRVIFLIRDPRDICISGSYHWRITSKEFLQRMIKGNVANIKNWQDYINEWFDIINNPLYGDLFKVVKYEDLLANKRKTLKDILTFIGYEDFSRINFAIKNNDFAKRKKELKTKKALRKHNMRKGISGDWQNHFNQEMNDCIISEFGEVMRKFEYV